MGITNSHKERRLLVGPLLLTAITLVVRTFLVSKQLYGDRWYLIIDSIALGSLSVLGLQGALAVISYWTCTRSLRALVWIISSSIALLFLLETYVLIVFDVRLALVDILKYGRSAKLLLHAFMNINEAAVLVIAIGASMLSIRATSRSVRALIIASVAFSVVGLWKNQDAQPSEISRYDSNPFALFAGITKNSPDMPYTERELEYYTKLDGPHFRHYTLPHPPIPIIVLIIEGLSSADSAKISGVNDRLKRFDRITSEGTLFTEFFANYWDSEGGLISILHGVPPFPYPGNTRLMTSSFSRAPSAISVFMEHGYHTELLSAFTLSWTDLKSYLAQIGFDSVRGRDEVPAFLEAPKFTFDAPTDKVLYNEALARAKDLLQPEKPFILFALTISSHIPYTDPLGRGNTEENVWEYVDQEFATFYTQLKATGFLEKGILMVLGDHRKAGQVTDPERARYGESAKARTPLAIFGRGVTPGRIDQRPFQQVDLLTNIPAMLDGNSPLSEDLVFVERYSDFSVFKVQESGGFEVFNPQDRGKTSFRGHVAGNSLKWLDREPTNANNLERSIHSVRARLQRSRREIGKRCGTSLPTLGTPGDEPGAQVLHFDRVALSQPLNRSLPAFKGDFDLPDLSKESLATFLVGKGDDYSLAFHTFLKIDTPGLYWFRLGSDDGSCLFIDSKLIIDANESKPFSFEDRRVFLDRGVWPLEMRYFQGFGDYGLELLWKSPSDKEWVPVPSDLLLQPR